MGTYTCTYSSTIHAGKETGQRAGEVSKSEHRLPFKHEDPSLIPRLTLKINKMAWWCKVLIKAFGGGERSQTPATDWLAGLSLLGEGQTNGEYYFKKIKKKGGWDVRSTS